MMNTKDIDTHIERVERTCEANVLEKDILALIARGVWEVARQLSRFNDLAAGDEN